MSIYLKVLIEIIITFFVVFDVYIFISSRKNSYEKTGLKCFLLEDLFFVGERVFEIGKISVSGKRIRKLEEIYDISYAGKISKSASFAPITYFLLFFPVILSVLSISSNFLAFVAMLLLLVVLMIYFDFWLDGILKKRHEKILKEFAGMLSKMSLLVKAGITVNDAFERVSKSGDGILYKEMKRCVTEYGNGMPIVDSLDLLAFRCGCKEVRKFVSLYKQNLIKGGPEFPYLLQDMADTAFEDRKNRAKVKGSKTEEKLLIPIMLMFTGVLIMIIVPAFNSFI